MAQGNVVACACTSVANNGYLTIQPPLGVEWMIKNIYYGGAVNLIVTDGTNSINFDNDGSSGAKMGVSFMLTNSYYMQVQNVSGAPIFIKYDGIQTY